ncbi:hypothetical protein AB0I35_09780 [Nocardia sp. NPDC050378]|uniref:hypothetical protein n=1 Tax=Nocardia sp. NPDC050378 TaxID=3155400 RepID=UPI00340544D3
MDVEARKRSSAQTRRRAVKKSDAKNSTTGIRFTQADQVLVERLTKPGETKADVIRRALHELERREWLIAAQREAEQIDTSDEDLGREPDAW